jgi:hypothetical protein
MMGRSRANQTRNSAKPFKSAGTLRMQYVARHSVGEPLFLRAVGSR